jgi:hypothetical protein
VALSLSVLHASLASVTAAAGLALVASGAWSALRRTAPSIRMVLLVRQVTVIAALLAAAVGALLFLSGRRPQLALHYLYAFFAVVAVPLAMSLAARQPHRGGLYHMGAGVLVLLMCLRLLTTG